MIIAAEFARAQDGKPVQEGKAFVPEVLFEGKYHPICGHYFWNDNVGATAVCNLLGFNNGKMTQTKAKYDVDAMPVGQCKAGEELTKCTGGGNAWGNFGYDNGWCKKGYEIGVTVTCDSPGVSR